MEEVWHSLEVDDVLKRLNTSVQGLNREEAATRLEKYGFNELVAVRKVSPLRLLTSQFKSILLIILLGATAVSMAVGEVVDAIVILAIVIACAMLGFTQEYRAERALEALKKMLHPTASLMRSGKKAVIPVREIVPGDILVLREGDRVPADARLIEITSLLGIFNWRINPGH